MSLLSGVKLSSVNEDILSKLVCRTSCSSDVIRDFWKVLIACFNTPRPSTNYDGVNKEERTFAFRTLMRAICTNGSLTYREDGAGNIIISNFSESSNKKAEYCFQGHMDVVVSKNESEVHDFDTQGVDVCITEQNTVKPLKGITLGADNGVAIACGISILVHNKRNHRLELLITKNEETTFEGALEFDPTTVTAEYILNLDSEVEHAICVGSAGGFEQHFHLPVSRSAIDSHSSVYQLKIKDLKGGHSGCDIEKEKANSILAMSRILLVDGGVRIISICGGTSTNAIPRECTAIVVCSEDQLEQIRNNFDNFKSEFSDTEPSVILQIEKANVSANPITLQDSQKLLGLVFAIGTGVVRRRLCSGDVESSYNLGVVFSDAESVDLKCLARSTSVSWMKNFAKQLTAIGSLAGARMREYVGPFGAWEPDFNSDIVARLKNCRPLKDVPVKLYTVHAGLECSTILERFAEIGRTSVQCASIGPLIEHAHSPDECLHIDSAEDFVQWVDSLVNYRD